MKFGSLLVFSLLLMGCYNQEVEVLTQYGNTDSALVLLETLVMKSSIEYNHERSIWLYNDAPFSGFAVTYYPDSTRDSY